MKTNELKAERVRLNKTAASLAKTLGVSYSSYRQKEAGIVKFSADEIATLANELMLSPERVNDIFFDGKITEW